VIKRVILAVLVSAAFVSCAQNKSKIAPPPPAAYALLGELRVTGAPAEMPDAQRVAMEAVSLKIVGAGPVMVRPILADIQANRDPNRRFVLLKLFVMIVDAIPATAAEKAVYDKDIKAASEKLLGERDPGERRLGITLAALPQTSLLVPTAIKMLEDADASDRQFAITTLSQVTRVDLGYDPDGSPEGRSAAVKRWNSWWRGNKEQELYYSHTPGSNPVIQSLTGDLDEITRNAGPYALTVTDKATGKAVAGAVVAYSYNVTTFDGQGLARKDQTITDENGKVLMAAMTVAAGQKYTGAELIISKAGYRMATIRLLPHIVTRNSFAVNIPLEPAG
jgi:hypothetical protein